MKIIWTSKPLEQNVPLAVVLFIVVFVGFNVYLHLQIKNAKEALAQIESALIQPPRVVAAEFAKKIRLGETSCPSMKAGNPNAFLQFKLFESQMCPYCTAQNNILDELFPEYGDLFYAEWYEVTDCQKEATQYNISGVPTFVFKVIGEEKEPAYGLLEKDQLIEYICRVSQQC